MLSASPYSLDGLERILDREVYPILIPNPLGVAGEWAYFNPDRLVKRDPGTRPRRPEMAGLRMFRDDWRNVRARVKALRAGSSPTGP